MNERHLPAEDGPFTYEEMVTIMSDMAVEVRRLGVRVTNVEAMNKTLVEQVNFLTEQIIQYRGDAMRFGKEVERVESGVRRIAAPALGGRPSTTIKGVELLPR